MILSFQQSQWQGVAFDDLEVPSDGVVAGQRFYESFYRKLQAYRKPSSANVPWRDKEAHLQQKQAVASLISEVLSESGIVPGGGASILSVGAGQGFVEEILISEGFKVDLQECQDLSLKDFHTRHPKSRIIVCDARQIEAPDQSYDATFCVAVDYIFSREDWLAVMRQMKRVLRPKGLLIVVTVSNLSMREIILCLPKKILGLIRPRFETKSALWGYQRTLDEHVRTAALSGISLKKLVGIDQKGSMLWQRAPTCFDGWFACTNSAQTMIVGNR